MPRATSRPTTTETASQAGRRHRRAPTPQAQASSIPLTAVQRAAADPHGASPAAVLQLQRRYGNRAVQRAIQAKLVVGAAQDAYEQEADRMAARLTGGAPASAPPASPPPAQTPPPSGSPTDLQRAPAEGSFEAGAGFEQQLAASRGGGAPLPEATRGRMEAHFAADFSSVRVHTGPQADQLNRDVQARAFTHGSDVYFAAGQYAPATSAGQSLLAHELTHVVQQSGAAQRAPAVQRALNQTVAELGALGSAEAKLAVAPIAAALQAYQDGYAAELAQVGPAPNPDEARAASDRDKADWAAARREQPPEKLRRWTELLAARRDRQARLAQRVAAYDQRLARLDALEIACTAWLAGLPAGEAALVAYVDRLKRAALRESQDLQREQTLAAKARDDVKAAVDAGQTTVDELQRELAPVVPAVVAEAAQGVPPPEPPAQVLAPPIGAPGLPPPTGAPGLPPPTGALRPPSTGALRPPPSGAPGLPPRGATAPRTAPAPALPPGKLLVYPDITPAVLTEGDRLLQQLRQTRPDAVNNAAAVGSPSALSNCGIVTMAALMGHGRTASSTAIQYQQLTHGSAFDPTGKTQSQNMWAMSLLPADVALLQAEGLIGALDQEGFEEGKAYVIGDAQYYGMLNFLLQFAESEKTDTVSFQVYEYGEPGNDMHPAPALITTMAAYPRGTRFAVFLLGTAPGQHVRQHWVYAENFGGQIVFTDYQPNEAASGPRGQTKPAGFYLGRFPYSPDPEDAKKNLSFQSGSFIAFAPVFAGETLRVPGSRVSPERISGILNSIRDRLAILEASRGILSEETQSTMPRAEGFAALHAGKTPLTEIPEPGMVDTMIRQMVRDFGQTPKCDLGSLTNPDAIRIIGHPRIRVRGEGGALGGEAEFVNRNLETSVVGARGETRRDTEQLPATGRGFNAGRDFQAAFQQAYTLSAQAVEEKGENYTTRAGIIFHAYMAQFTDIIHEGMHTFERASLPKPIKEGCADIFAGMVSARIQRAGGDARFQYKYNPSYAPYVVAVKQLIRRLGLRTVAELYFTKSGKVADALQAMLKRLRPNAGDDQIALVVTKLTSEAGFPSQFYEGLSDFDALPTAAAPPPQGAGVGLEGEYGAHETRFAAFLDQLVGPAGAALGEREKAERAVSADAAAIDEQLLQQAYRMRDEATGTIYADVSKRIYYLERSILQRTGETRERMRDRLVKPVVVTFRARESRAGRDERLYVLGNTAELGNDDPARALPMRHTGSGWEVMVELFFKREQEIRYSFIAKGGTTVVQTDGAPLVYRKTLPNSRQVTLVDQRRRR